MNDTRDEEGEYKSFEEEIYWRYIKQVSFHTTFRSDSRHKLKIPKKFADNIRSNLLHQKMTLRAPSGVNWETDLIRVGDDLFLQNGWQEFANAHSLQENDILIFKYDRNSTFRVKIFGGECEKIAAYFVKKCGHVYPADENQKKRVLSVTEDVENGVKKSRKNAGIEPVNHMGKVRRCVTISKKILSNRKRVQSAINLVRKNAAPRSMMGKQGRDSHAEIAPPHQSGFENIALSAKKAETVPDKEHGQCSLNNDEVPCQSGFKNIALPAKIAETGPAKKQKHNSLLNNEVPVSVETGLAKQPDASIKKELIYPGTKKNVASPRTRGRPKPSLCGPADIECISNRRPVTDEEKTNAMRKAAAKLSENSFLVALPIFSCYKFFHLTIPAIFAKAHLGLRKQDVCLCIGKKKWITEFSFSNGRLHAGWRKFAVENNLEESDVCLFKLVSGEPVMLDVTIFRVVDEVTPPTLSIVP